MKFLFVIFLLPLQLFAQDITGVWTGTLYNDTTKQCIKYELAISEYNGKLSGYSHTIFVIDSFENIGLKSIKVKKAGKEFLLEDDKLIYNNYTEPPAKHVKTFSELGLSQNDTAMILSGPWNTNRTKVYTRLTGNIFLQKRKKIQETLIIGELENLGLTGSLSFMNSPSQSKDLGIVNNPGFNMGEPNKPVDITGDVVSNTAVPANTEIQQADKQSKAGEPISEAVLNKEGTVKEKTAIRSVQLPVADMTIQKDETTDVIPTSKVSIKSEPQQIGKQQKAGKEIPGKVLNKNDSAVNKDVIKAVPSLIAEMSTPKNEPTNIASIKSETPQIGKQQKANRETPQLVLNKDDSVANKDKIKKVPSLKAEMSTSKDEPTNIASIKSETPQIGKQQKANREIPQLVLNKDDSVVNKDRIKKVPSLKAEMSTPKDEPTNIASIKSETPQIDNPQKAEKEIPDMVLQKDHIEGIITVKQAVSQAAAEIATRKIEAIRSVEIKSDSLLLTLYDNGEVDGDTVSVLLNGKVIMPMEGLSLKAINKTIYLTPEMGDSIVLIMYAENLGSIPPNTGLLVIHDGDDVYEIRFTGDLEKNSSIILKRKKKKEKINY